MRVPEKGFKCPKLRKKAEVKTSMQGQILLLITAIILFFFSCNLEKGWEGIKVLESSRADVEKKLGKPTKEEDGLIWYENEDAYFRFLFSDGPCVAPDTLLGGFNVKQGIVVQYEVRPKKTLTIGELGLDLNLFKRFEDPEVLQFSHYDDSRDAISITAFKMSVASKEIIRTVYYNRTTEQVRKFSCK